VQPDLIYDVGANTGQDTEFYLKKGFRVVAIEANPRLVGDCRVRFERDLSRGRLQLLNVGVGIKPGPLTLYINKTYHEWSSLFEDIGKRGGEFDTVTVDVVTLDDVLKTHGVPYYLKIDIEGMDNAAIQAAGRLADRPRYISVETGPGPAWIDALHEISYQWFKLVDQTTVESLVCPDPSREGKTIPHRFVAGSSGPFGEETPGEWRSHREVRQEWLDILAKPDPKNLWFDIHAKLS
jgi:FkbM family methyltransferase